MRRHRNGGRAVRSALVPVRSGKAVEPVYLPGTLKNRRDVYGSDGAHGSRFKWLISTCIAGAIGLGTIGVFIFVSMDDKGVRSDKSVFDTIARVSQNATKVADLVARPNDLQAAIRKSDRIVMTEYGLTTRDIIHDSVVEKRGVREYISIKPYARIIATLSTERAEDGAKIPALNPFSLYSNPKPVSANGKTLVAAAVNPVLTKVVELATGLLPSEDGEELSYGDIEKLVHEASEIHTDGQQVIRPGIHPVGDTGEEEFSLDTDIVEPDPLSLPPNTTMIEKRVAVGESVEQREIKTVTVKKGDRIGQLLRDAGAETWQSQQITGAMTKVYPANKIKQGQVLRLTLAPAPSLDGAMEPVAVSLLSGKRHLVTVFRNDAGDYVARKDPLNLDVADALRTVESSKRATLYSSLFNAALVERIPPDKIMRILRIHAYDVDFKRRVRPGDSFKAFFDLNRDGDLQSTEPKELLYTSINIGEQEKGFFRFRTPDGLVDFFDKDGSSAKKFLLRKPVRGARFTSAFGFRRHPISRALRMHRGVDWAARHGTPILAAGNGIVEVAGRKGGFGNYIRIRHPNGYKTAYGHLQRYAKGLRPGIKVSIGQVIGYVGSSGYSTGPHLHYEVLVNNRHVDPMKIEVPRGRVLKGRVLAKFQKEMTRIEELMRRPPVDTKVTPLGPKGMLSKKQARHDLGVEPSQSQTETIFVGQTTGN